MKTLYCLIITGLVCLFTNDIYGQVYQIQSNGTSPVCGNATGKLTLLSGNPTVVRWEVGTFNGTFTVENTIVTSNSYYDYTVTAPATKAFRAYCSGASGFAYTNVIIVTANVAAEAGSISTPDATSYHLASSSGTLYATGYSSTPGWAKRSGNGSWVNIGTGASYTYSGLTETTTFKSGVSAGACGDESNEITIVIYKPGTLLPPTTLIDNIYCREGDIATLTLQGNSGPVVRWEYTIDNGTTWQHASNTGQSYSHLFTTATKFRVMVGQGQFGQSYSNEVEVLVKPYTEVIQSQGIIVGDNNVKEQQVIVRGITDPATVDALTADQKRQVTIFQDGFERVIQQNINRASLAQKDIVTVAAYDTRGMQAVEYLPYTSGMSDGAFRTNPVSEQTTFYANGTSDKIADSAFPFTKSIIEKSPLALVTEQGSVGQQWQPGSGHSTLINYSTNDVNEVRLFKPDGTSTAFYSINELLRAEVTDADGKKVQTFTDKAGRTILKRVQLGETVSGSLVPWLETYSIYNFKGALKYIVSPKGIAALKANAWTLTQAIKDQYFHEFVYDNLGRLVEKKVPGQAWVYYCYDRLDRLVLMQDGNIRSANKWFFIKYDRAGRPVMKGLYQNTTQTSRTAVQVNVVDPLYALDTDKYYEVRGTVLHGYTNQSFPVSSTEILTVDYYDTYDFNGTNNYTYTYQGLAGENTPASSAFGRATGSKYIVLGSTTWLYNYVFYDTEGRPIQLLSNNHLSTAIDNITTLVYDFEGKQKISKVYHNADSGRVTTVINKFDYDHMGRLLRIYQNNNSAPSDQLVVQYEYNELGQLVDKKLHNTSGTSFLQSIDLRYSVQGWLTSINNAQLTADAVTNDEANDYFGMEMLYEKVETGLTAATSVNYNGNISAMKWKGVGAQSGIADQRSYKHTYDKANRLKTSISQMNTGSAWSKEAGSVSENLTYDLNGNVATLARNQRKHQLTGVVASYTHELIDNLAYLYNPALGDQLLRVTDATGNVAGFNNGSSSTSNDYTYDAVGNMMSDRNKGISNVIYNVLGKVSVVTFSDTRKIEYTYDAVGTKLTMKTYAAGSSTPSMTTHYISGFVYENGNLSFFASPEGRVVKKGSSLEYQYAIADHLGNTRVVFSSVNPTKPPAKAAFENVTTDSQEFTNINSSTMYWVPKSAANNTPSGQYVIRMNNSYKTGPAKSMKVYPGDVLDMEVYSYFEGGAGFGGTNQPLTGLITSVAGAFGGVSGAVGESGAIYNGVNAAYTAYGSHGNLGDARPTAYLNYILLDRNYKLLDMGWKPVPEAANMNKQRIYFDPIKIKEAGFMYVYLSYEGEGTNWVYFDDLKVTHTKTNVVQYNEYYPYGLQTNMSWTREDSKNNFLYNAASELNQASGWYEMLYRNYDPAIARFTGVDPLASKYAALSGYHYGYDNPVRFNDPTGAYGIQPGPADGYMDGFYDTFGYTNYYNQANADGYVTPHERMFLGVVAGNYRQGEMDQVLLNYNSAVRDHNSKREIIGFHFSYVEDAHGNMKPSTFVITGYEYADEAQQVKQGWYDLEIIDYSPLIYGDGRGIHISIGVTDNNHGYKNLNWVQTVRTNRGVNGAKSPYNDPQDNPDDLPFYDTPWEVQFKRNSGGYDLIFEDRPRRDKPSEYTYWHGELSLVGEKGGKHYILQTITYGYEVKIGGAFIIYPVTSTLPSQFQTNTVNSLNH
jgi:RHS repeat-associated protein